VADYAIVENDVVVNVIVADDQATAEALTGGEVMALTNGLPGVGWTLEAEGWRPPLPFPSWDWDGTAWAAPIAYPADEGHYYWDEEQGDWIEYVVPEPEPEPAPVTE
jgi:hypothetical protein